jgi:hypothetical protein
LPIEPFTRHKKNQITYTSDRCCRNDPHLYDRKKEVESRLEQILPIPLKGGTDEDVRNDVASPLQWTGTSQYCNEDVMTRMLSNIIWVQSGHIAFVSCLHCKKTRSDPDWI